MKWYQVPHLLHALAWMVVAFGGAYVFFTQTPGMLDLRIDVICAAGMAIFVGAAVLLYRLMFRKKLALRNRTTARTEKAPVDVIQDARNKAR
jgi:hypothetical protein